MFSIPWWEREVFYPLVHSPMTAVAGATPNVKTGAWQFFGSPTGMQGHTWAIFSAFLRLLERSWIRKLGLFRVAGSPTHCTTMHAPGWYLSARQGCLASSGFGAKLILSSFFVLFCQNCKHILMRIFITEWSNNFPCWYGTV